MGLNIIKRLFGKCNNQKRSELVGTGPSGQKFYIDSELVWIGANSGRPFIIDGVDVWKHKWMDTKERADVRSPGDTLHTFHVYEIHSDNKIVRFAAGEVSQSVYGFAVYVKR